jgi:hypothetical protein
MEIGFENGVITVLAGIGLLQVNAELLKLYNSLSLMEKVLNKKTLLKQEIAKLTQPEKV